MATGTDDGSAAARAASRDGMGESDAAHDTAADDSTVDALDRALAAWDAARALLVAARGFVLALAGLARSELTVARASVPWIIAFSIILVGLALSLWLSLVALAAWALYIATGSIGWALAALALLHVLGLFVTAWALKRSSRALTMPATRAQVQGLLARARGRPAAERTP